MPLDLRRMYTRRGAVVAPNPVQRWVLDAMQSAPVVDLLVSGGLGGGKTAVGAQALFEMMVRNCAITNGAPLNYAIVSSSLSQLERVTLETFRGVWNAATGWSDRSDEATFLSNPTVLRWNRQKKWFRLNINATVHYDTGETGATSIEGAEYTAVWCDEPAMCKEATQPRLRERRRENLPGTLRGIISTGTPRPGWSLSWLHERFGKGLDDYIPDDQGRCRVALPTALNLANLDPGYEDRLKREYSPRMMEAMLRGRFVILTGAVYSDWNELAVVEYQHDPTKDVIAGWDPGYRRAAFVFVQPTQAYLDGSPLVGEEGWTIFDELMTADCSTEEQARRLARLQWMQGRSRITIAHDPAGVGRQSTTGKSDLIVLTETLQSMGITVDLRTSRRKEDHAITARCERLRSTIMAADGVRRLTIAGQVTTAEHETGEDGRKTIGIHQALLEQPFKKGTDYPDDGPTWKPHTHAPDALGYLAVYLNPARSAMEPGWLDAAKAANDGPLFGAGMAGTVEGSSWVDGGF